MSSLIRQAPVREDAQRVRLEVGAGEGPAPLAVEGHEAVLPDGRGGALEVETRTAATGAGETSRVEIESAGAGLRSTDSGAVSGFQSQPPEVVTPAMRVGGGLTLWQRVTGQSKGMLALYGLTGLVFVAGLVLAVFLNKRLMGICVCASAMVLLAIVRLLDVYPWAPFIALALGAVVGLWFLLDAWRNKAALARETATAAAVVKSYEAVKAVLPAEVAETASKVMGAVQGRGSEVEARVKAIKAGG